MNHLAHALIAVRSGGSVLGQLLGDFVKGDPGRRWEGELLEGIVVHRRIDAFTDDHGTVRRSRRRVVPPYRRFAGILVDLFYDHLLAVEWEQWSERSLRDFADDVYAELEAHRARLPERMRRFAEYARATDLLVAYREVEGIDRALQGIAWRLGRPSPLGNAVEVLERHRDGFREDFRAFFPELLREFGAGG